MAAFGTRNRRATRLHHSLIAELRAAHDKLYERCEGTGLARRKAMQDMLDDCQHTPTKALRHMGVVMEVRAYKVLRGRFVEPHGKAEDDKAIQHL